MKEARKGKAKWDVGKKFLPVRVMRPREAVAAPLEHVLERRGASESF